MSHSDPLTTGPKDPRRVTAFYRCRQASLSGSFDDGYTTGAQLRNYVYAWAYGKVIPQLRDACCFLLRPLRLAMLTFFGFWSSLCLKFVSLRWGGTAVLTPPPPNLRNHPSPSLRANRFCAILWYLISQPAILLRERSFKAAHRIVFFPRSLWNRGPPYFYLVSPLAPSGKSGLSMAVG